MRVAAGRSGSTERGAFPAPPRSAGGGAGLRGANWCKRDAVEDASVGQWEISPASQSKEAADGVDATWVQLTGVIGPGSVRSCLDIGHLKHSQRDAGDAKSGQSLSVAS